MDQSTRLQRRVVRHLALLHVLVAACAVGCSSSSGGAASTTGQNASEDAGGSTIAAGDGGSAAASSPDATTAADASHALSTGDGAITAHDASGGDAATSAGDASTPGDAATTSVPDGDLPAGDAGGAAYCNVYCGRVIACVSGATCSCNPASVVLWRSDYVAALEHCYQTASCSDIVESIEADASSADSGLDLCESTALAQITPTPAVTAFCSQVGDSTCSQDAITDCPDTIKPYSDQTVSALSACVANPDCADHTACLTQALTP